MNIEQNLSTNFKQSFDLVKDNVSFSKDTTFETKDTPNEENIENSSSDIFFANDLDFDSLKSLQVLLINEYPLYLIDYSLPSEINTDGFALRFGDLKVDYLKKTRLALAISTTILSISLVTALLALPYPYKVGALALCGPLFVSTYGLVTQKQYYKRTLSLEINFVKAFLKLFRIFSRTPRQKLLRGIDHTIVVIFSIALVTLLFTAGEKMAIEKPVESQFQNIFALGVSMFLCIGGFGACEFITRYLITPYRS